MCSSCRASNEKVGLVHTDATAGDGWEEEIGFSLELFSVADAKC